MERICKNCKKFRVRHVEDETGGMNYHECNITSKGVLPRQTACKAFDSIQDDNKELP